MGTSTPTNEDWQLRKITTPTFELKPAEKPDMSPFLVHLTGKDRLKDILNGNGAEVCRPGWGFLRSGIPSYAQQHYHSPVVCFTETPIFALDFFRLRSYNRFMGGQQYGIGFSKKSLVQERGVRPVLYLDNRLNADLLRIIQLAEAADLKLTEDSQLDYRLSMSMRKLKPLMFPLFENSAAQGFMWEREWRYPEPDGFSFPFSEIEIICCPNEERDEIKSLLGSHASRVEIVENWKEYDEVKNYLQSRGMNVLQNLNVNTIQDINELLKLKDETQQMMNGLHLFKTTFELSNSPYNVAYIDDKLKRLLQFHFDLEQQIEMIASFERERFEEMLAEYHQQQIRDYY